MGNYLSNHYLPKEQIGDQIYSGQSTNTLSTQLFEEYFRIIKSLYQNHSDSSKSIVLYWNQKEILDPMNKIVPETKFLSEFKLYAIDPDRDTLCVDDEVVRLFEMIRDQMKKEGVQTA
jgi:hypothetical protein